MKYFVYIRGHVMVFKVETKPVAFWDGGIIDFNEVEILQVTRTNGEQQTPTEWEILDRRKDWKICIFQ
jgi:hypothetical protein